MSPHIHPPDKWLSFGFALIGGYGDAAGFVLAKTFTGHVTGSLVLAVIALVSQDWRPALAHSTALACFLSGIPLSALIARPSTTFFVRSSLTVVMVLELVLFVAAYLASLSHASGRIEILVVCWSLALGLQNGAFRRTGGISVHTTYLTGMITGLIATKSENVASTDTTNHASNPDSKSRLVSGIWGLFVLGAALGAAATLRFGQFGMLGPALILSVIMARNLAVVPRECAAA